MTENLNNRIAYQQTRLTILEILHEHMPQVVTAEIVAAAAHVVRSLEAQKEAA